MRRYRAAPAAALRWQAMDGLALIYHRASGITHVVASPVPELLGALATQALSEGELMTALARDYELADGDRAGLAARLAELVAAGLVEAA